MKIISTALLTIGLASLAACGGGGTNNAAASNNVSEPLPPVDNGGDLNGAGPVDANAPAPAPVDANATANAAASNSAGNSH